MQGFCSPPQLTQGRTPPRLFFAGKFFGETVAAEWEDRIGGRVCPNFFSSSSVVTDTIYGSTSPFVLLVHHRHAFMNWDPVRFIQKTFFPEGFPSHPHRGFVTVTYCLAGGMLHRDSMGIKQAYGAEQRHGGNHVQWLNTGSGLQHEEMWDVSEPDEKDEGSLLQTSSQELYQIWLNVPSSQKMTGPKAQLLQKYGMKDESDKPPPYSTPIITEGGVTTTVVCGDHNGVHAPWDIPTDAAILRVELTKGATWEHSMPVSHKTAIIYVKSGFIEIEGDRIAPHHTAYLTQGGQTLTVHACDDSADILLLSGAPILAPCYSQGSMVMNSQSEIQQAYQDYQSGHMGVPWDYKLTDEEWQEHIKRYPSIY